MNANTKGLTELRSQIVKKLSVQTPGKLRRWYSSQFRLVSLDRRVARQRLAIDFG